jgi:hypothetical protein
LDERGIGLATDWPLRKTEGRIIEGWVSAATGSRNECASERKTQKKLHGFTNHIELLWMLDIPKIQFFISNISFQI